MTLRRWRPRRPVRPARLARRARRSPGPPTRVCAPATLVAGHLTGSGHDRSSRATCSPSTRPTPRRSPTTPIRTRAHQAWRHGQVLLRRRATSRLDARRPRHRRSPPTGSSTRSPGWPGRSARSRRTHYAVRCARGIGAERPADSGSRRDRAREIALLTNPTAGKGRGAQGARRPRCARLRGGRAQRPRPGRAATPTRRSTWPAQCVADGVEALVVVGGDGMVHLGVQAVAGTETRAGHHPGRHRQRRRPLLRPPAQGPGAPRPTWSSAGDTRTRRPGPERDRRTSSTVLAAGFDAIVNERANRMTWPKGQMRYNLATLAELRTFKPLPYTLDLDGETRRARGDAGRGRQRAVVRRRAADHRGRPARRRPARRGDHQADEQARTWSAPTRSCSRAPTPPTRSTSTTGSAGDRRRAGHRRRTPTASGSARCRSPWSARRGR